MRADPNKEVPAETVDWPDTDRYMKQKWYGHRNYESLPFELRDLQYMLKRVNANDREDVTYEVIAACLHEKLDDIQRAKLESANFRQILEELVKAYGFATSYSYQYDKEQFVEEKFGNIVAKAIAELSEAGMGKQFWYDYQKLRRDHQEATCRVRDQEQEITKHHHMAIARQEGEMAGRCGQDAGSNPYKFNYKVPKECEGEWMEAWKTGREIYNLQGRIDELEGDVEILKEHIKDKSG